MYTFHFQFNFVLCLHLDSRVLRNNNKVAFYNIVIRTIYFAEIRRYINFRLYKYLLTQERKNSCEFDIYKSDFHSLDKEIALPKIEKKTRKEIQKQNEFH